VSGPRPAGRPWTLTDDDQLRKLMVSGMKRPLIARKLNRTVDPITNNRFKAPEGEGEMTTPRPQQWTQAEVHQLEDVGQEESKRG
jgi:hypothetical protein